MGEPTNSRPRRSRTQPDARAPPRPALLRHASRLTPSLASHHNLKQSSADASPSLHSSSHASSSASATGHGCHAYTLCAPQCSSGMLRPQARSSMSPTPSILGSSQHAGHTGHGGGMRPCATPRHARVRRAARQFCVLRIIVHRTELNSDAGSEPNTSQKWLAFLDHCVVRRRRRRRPQSTCRLWLGEACAGSASRACR